MNLNSDFLGDRPERTETRGQTVVSVCDRIIRWTVMALAAFVPVFFLPFTPEVLEFNKQTVIVAGAAVAGLAWIGKMLAERRLEYRRTAVNTIVLLYLAAHAVSAIVSRSRYVSVVGGSGQEMSGLVTVAALAVIYFVVVNGIRTVRALNGVFFALIVGGFLSGLYALLQGLGLFVLPFDFSRSASFNTVGTFGMLCLYQAFIVTLIGGLLMRHEWRFGDGVRGRIAEIAKVAFMAVTAAVGLVLVAMVDFWPVTVSLLAASVLLLGFAVYHARSFRSMGGVIIPTVAVLASVMLLLFRFPASLSYPAEVMPSMKASANIAVQTLRESPFFGSGPATFAHDYAKYRVEEINATAFWNIRFDRGASYFLTMLATTGLLGTLSWLMVAVFLLFSAVRKLLSSDDGTWQLVIGVFAAWFLLFLSKFLYGSTIALEFATWVMTALLVIVHRKDFIRFQFDSSPRAAMSLSFVFVLGLAMAISGGFVWSQRYLAEAGYADAIRISQAGGDMDQVIERLSRSIELNPRNDAYFRNISQAFIAKADQESEKPVTLDRNEGEGEEDYQARLKAAQDERLRRVTSLASDAVNAAKRASEMDPKNVSNWSVLASVYQKLFGISQGADEWAVKSYETAIELEPANPSLHNELGNVYLYQGDVRADEAKKTEAGSEDNVRLEKERDDLYAKAVESLEEAIRVKGDFAVAHFYLGVALDRQGKLKEAIRKMESVLAYSPQDVGVGFQLALLYYRDGRKDDAIGLMEGVVSLSPEYSNALWYLASMYEERGDLEKAIDYVRKVAQLNPDNQEVAGKLAEMEAKKSAPLEGLPVPDPDALPVPVE
ncbi:tetratricopeptide repeat protein [Candidatus Uhrbacteria bacterium]|nr:tetratricopeptide repeat protein [Candidatus Uhrbacteria bacterium]